MAHLFLSPSCISVCAPSLHPSQLKAECIFNRMLAFSSMESTSYTGYGIVYRALCVPSGKSYVGQTVRTLEQRWRAHKESQSACHALKSAIRKYGAKAFVLSILDTANDQSDLNAKEEHWIATLGTVSPGVTTSSRLTKGGNVCPLRLVRRCDRPS